MRVMTTASETIPRAMPALFHVFFIYTTVGSHNQQQEQKQEHSLLGVWCLSLLSLALAVALRLPPLLSLSTFN